MAPTPSKLPADVVAFRQHWPDHMFKSLPPCPRHERAQHQRDTCAVQRIDAQVEAMEQWTGTLSKRSTKRQLFEIRGEIRKLRDEVDTMHHQLSTEKRNEGDVASALRLVLAKVTAESLREAAAAEAGIQGLRTALADLRDMEGYVRDAVNKGPAPETDAEHEVIYFSRFFFFLMKTTYYKLLRP